MKSIANPAIATLHHRFCISREDYRALAARVREELVTGCAAAACVHGLGVLKDPEPIHAWFPGAHSWYPEWGSIRYAKIGKSLRGRIRQGGLHVAGELRPWSPDFLHGLKMSGALRRESHRDDRRWQVWIPTHPALADDLRAATPLPKRVEVYPSTPSVCRISRCPALWLPPDDPKGAEVVAGLLAGAELWALDDDEQWLLVPDDPAIRGLLEFWTILHRPVRLPKRKAMVAISPFYAAIFSHLMPPHSAARVLSCRNPAMGDLLPLLHWEVLFSDRGQRTPPFAGALPFCMSERTLRRREIDRTTLHRRAVCEEGLARIAPGIRALLRRWFAEACKMRASRPQESEETAASEAHGQPIVPHTVSVGTAV